MPEQLTDDQQALAEVARRFVADALAPLSVEHGDDPAALRSAIIEAAKTARLYFLTQPRSHGGSEAGMVELTVVREILAASGLPARRWAFGPGPGFLADAEGTLARDYAEPLLRGDKRTAFAFTDAHDGPPTEAHRSAAGWILRGRKGYVTGGADADFFGVVARMAPKPARAADQEAATEDATARLDRPETKHSLFAVVDADAVGLTVSPPFTSLDGSHHVALDFADVFVPDAALIGRPGEGLPRALRQIGDTRISMAAEACGLMQCALGHLEAHLGKPHRSGEPLGAREGVRLRFADLRIEAYAARSMLYRTARLAAAGANVVNEGIATKVFTTEALGRIVDTALQLEGGAALVEDHLLARLYREVRALRLAEGASDVLRLNLARGRLELGKGRL